MDKLKRQVRVLTTLQLVTILMIVFLVSKQPDKLTETKNFYSTGAQGLQGPQGVPGVGFAGKDGASVIGPIGPSGPPGAQGAQGEKGEPGAPGKDGENGKDGQDGQDGRTVEFRTNPETCDVEYKYTTNRTWQTLVEQDCEDAED